MTATDYAALATDPEEVAIEGALRNLRRRRQMLHVLQHGIPVLADSGEEPARKPHTYSPKVWARKRKALKVTKASRRANRGK